MLQLVTLKVTMGLQQRGRRCVSLERRWLFLVALVFGLLGVGVVPVSAAEPAYTPTIEQSIVQIKIEWQGEVQNPADGEWYPSSSGSRCTGWLVNNEAYIVTADHCVAENDRRKSELVKNALPAIQDGGAQLTEEETRDAVATWPVDRIERRISIDQPGVDNPVVPEERQVDVRAEDAAADHALLKLNGVENVPFLPLASQRVQVGEEISTYGFSGDVSGMTDGDTEGVTFTKGTVASTKKQLKGSPFLGVDLSVDNGMSGGPLFNTAGQVVGVNSFGSDDGSADLNFGTDLEYLRSFLRNNNVAFTTGVLSEPENDYSFALALIVIGVVVVAALGFVLYFRNKAKRSPVPATVPTQIMHTFDVLKTVVKCSECQHENPPLSKYCNQCRAELSSSNGTALTTSTETGGESSHP